MDPGANLKTLVLFQLRQKLKFTNFVTVADGSLTGTSKLAKTPFEITFRPLFKSKTFFFVPVTLTMYLPAPEKL